MRDAPRKKRLQASEVQFSWYNMNSEARVLMELMSDSDSEDNLEGLMLYMMSACTALLSDSISPSSNAFVAISCSSCLREIFALFRLVMACRFYLPGKSISSVQSKFERDRTQRISQ